ncbi:hypothetical protein BDZ91DRAFT_725052 [Kalaharituber pfeilii]|nr:hypothetical protein BDZ91DRAFT_725052 [Kalaharituber pfeilii]
MLCAELRFEAAGESHWRPAKVDLRTHITADNKTLEYTEHKTDCEARGEDKPVPIKDPNIDSSGFTVASDVYSERCIIAYRTQTEDKICFAEVALKNNQWGNPTELNIDPSTTPGTKFALVYDVLDTDQRHFIFSHPDGTGILQIQTYKGFKWGLPGPLRKPGSSPTDKDGLRAHRFTAFAATFSKQDELLLIYCVDENGQLVEFAGKWYTKENINSGDTPGYRWRQTKVIAERVQLIDFLSAVDKDGISYVLYRDSDQNLVMAVGKNRQKWDQEDLTADSGVATWKMVNIRNKSGLLKKSALAIAIKKEYKNPVAFFVSKKDNVETIMSIEAPLKLPDVTSYPAQPVGRLEPDSNIAAASLPAAFCANRPPIRLFSVSKLDGEDVLMERIQKRSDQQWVISGGIVNTDTSGLVGPRESC